MKHDKLPVALIAVMFLTIGVMFCMNDILLPIVREAFNLSYLEATSIQISFYIVYLIWPLAISSAIGKYGYRKNIIAAMAICFTGCMMFVPAYYLNSYFLILLGVFTVSTGVTVINVAANPYATLLGTPDGAHVRLNFVQCFRLCKASLPIFPESSSPISCLPSVYSSLPSMGCSCTHKKGRGPLPMCAQPYMIDSCGVAILSSVSCVGMAKSIRYPFARLRSVQE